MENNLVVVENSPKLCLHFSVLAAYSGFQVWIYGDWHSFDILISRLCEIGINMGKWERGLIEIVLKKVYCVWLIHIYYHYLAFLLCKISSYNILPGVP